VWYTSKHCSIQSPTTHLRQYVVVHFFTVFPVWRLLLSALTWHERWDSPFSLACVTGILYMEWSLPTNLPAGLLVWLCTWISILALSSNPSATFSCKISSKIFSCLFCHARCVHWPIPCRTDERKVSSTILLSFFQMNNRTASGPISPHQSYACSPTLQLVLFYDLPPLTIEPQQVHLHGEWLGERHHGCPPT
jgi:hypothetical protein